MKILRFFLASAFLIFLALAGAGCRTVSITPPGAFQARDVWAVAVFPLNDMAATRAADDYTLYGTTGAQGSGPLVGRELAFAFAQQKRFRLIPENALLDLMQSEGLTLADLAHLPDEKAAELGRKLNADMVVTGKVTDYCTFWILFVPHSKVTLDLRGVDPQTNQSLWGAHVGESSCLRSEREMVRVLARDVAMEVHQGLTASPKE